MCEATEKQVLVHRWEDNGVGIAPFRCVSMIAMPSAESFGTNLSGYQNAMEDAHHQAKQFGVQLGSCNVCGTGIHNHYVIRDKAGKHFVVGCDCVMKTDDSKLMTETKAIERKRNREIRQAKQAAQWEAAKRVRDEALQAQRDRNGGLTDSEVAEQNRQALIASQRAEWSAKNEWLLKVLDGRNGEFVVSMIESLERGPVNGLSDRCISILRDIYCKSHGRSGSKAYDAAYDEFDKLAEISE